MASGSRRSSRPAIILFGDSITQWSFGCAGKGFGDVLESKFMGRANVWNEGHAGYTSTDLLDDFATLISLIEREQHSPLLFTICLGANDACFRRPSTNGTLVPLPKFESNIKHFVDTLLTNQRCSSTKILLITPPPINLSSRSCGKGDMDGLTDEERLDAIRKAAREDLGFRTYVSKATFGDAVMQIANEYAQSEASADRVEGLDIWRAMVNAGIRAGGGSSTAQGPELLPPWPQPVNWSDDGLCGRLPGSGFPVTVNGSSRTFPSGWFTDGLHLGSKGYEVFTQALLEVLNAKWPELLGGNMG